MAECEESHETHHIHTLGQPITAADLRAFHLSGSLRQLDVIAEIRELLLSNNRNTIKSNKNKSQSSL